MRRSRATLASTDAAAIDAQVASPRTTGRQSRSAKASGGGAGASKRARQRSAQQIQRSVHEAQVGPGARASRARVAATASAVRRPHSSISCGAGPPQGPRGGPAVERGLPGPRAAPAERLGVGRGRRGRCAARVSTTAPTASGPASAPRPTSSTPTTTRPSRKGGALRGHQVRRTRVTSPRYRRAVPVAFIRDPRRLLRAAQGVRPRQGAPSRRPRPRRDRAGRGPRRRGDRGVRPVPVIVVTESASVADFARDLGAEVWLSDARDLNEAVQGAYEGLSARFARLCVVHGDLLAPRGTRGLRPRRRGHPRDGPPRHRDQRARAAGGTGLPLRATERTRAAPTRPRRAGWACAFTVITHGPWCLDVDRPQDLDVGPDGV